MVLEAADVSGSRRKPTQQRVQLQNNLCSSRRWPCQREVVCHDREGVWPTGSSTWKTKHRWSAAEQGNGIVVGNTLGMVRSRRFRCLAENFWLDMSRVSREAEDYCGREIRKVISRCIAMTTEPGEFHLTRLAVWHNRYARNDSGGGSRVTLRG